MERQNFRELFLAKLGRAAELAEARLGHPVPRQFGILRGTPEEDGRRVSLDDALAELWLSETRFYRIIDLAVVELSPSTTWVWARESGHPPSAFDETWNDPRGSGPFKILEWPTIRQSKTGLAPV